MARTHDQLFLVGLDAMTFYLHALFDSLEQCCFL